MSLHCVAPGMTTRYATWFRPIRSSSPLKTNSKLHALSATTNGTYCGACFMYLDISAHHCTGRIICVLVYIYCTSNDFVVLTCGSTCSASSHLQTSEASQNIRLLVTGMTVTAKSPPLLPRIIAPPLSRSFRHRCDREFAACAVLRYCSQRRVAVSFRIREVNNPVDTAAVSCCAVSISS